MNNKKRGVNTTDYSVFNNLYQSVMYLFVTRNNRSSVGSGVLLKFDGFPEPVIITNKHVVIDGSQLTIFLRKEQFSPSVEEKFDLIPHINLIFHPNPNVDLALIMFPKTFISGKMPNDYLLLPITEEMIFSPPNRGEGPNYIEDIVMFGNPSGIWSTKNSLCIACTGTTATPIQIAFSDNIDFIANIAGYSGSSGSPLFFSHNGKAFLVGILQRTHFRKIAFISQQINETMTLCDAIRANRILDFKSVLHQDAE